MDEVENCPVRDMGEGAAFLTLCKLYTEFIRVRAVLTLPVRVMGEGAAFYLLIIIYLFLYAIRAIARAREAFE